MTPDGSIVPRVLCGKCNFALPASHYNLPGFSSCPVCSSEIKIHVFPALFRGIVPGRAAQVILVEGDASCFYHPQKKAEVTCDHCGRFLCGLCDVDWGGKHLCPTCIESGKRQKSMGSLENRRILYDRIAMSLAILPMLIFYLTILTAPIALFVGFRYWSRPGSMVRSSRWRFILAILISGLQIIGWGVLIVFLISRIS